MKGFSSIEKTPPRPLTEPLILEGEQKLDKQPIFSLNLTHSTHKTDTKLTANANCKLQIQIQFEICNLSCTSLLPTLPCTATVSTTCTSSSRLDPQLLTFPLVCNISSSWLQHKSQPLFHLSLLATSSNTTSTCHFHWNRSHGTSPLPQSA